MSEHPNEETTLLAKHQNPSKYTENVEEDNAATSSQGTPEVGDRLSDSFIDNETSRFQCSRLSFYLVEPVVLILLFSYNLSSTVLKNQIIYQTCTFIFEYNATDCRLLGTKNTSDHIKYIETVVQPYAARIIMSATVIQNIIPALCGAFIGTWSDRFGRKPLLITSFTGFGLYYLFATVIAYLAKDMLVSPWYFVLAELPCAILGSSITYSVATFCYISDVTSREERVYRMVFYEAAVYIGLMIGSFTSGYLYEATNTTVVLAVSTSSIFFATFIIIFCIPESLNQSLAVQAEDSEQDVNTNRLLQLIDIKRLKEMWKTCFKTRELNDRAIVWLSMIILLIVVFVVTGSMDVFYLFIRAKFNWTVKEYTVYDTVNILIPIAGNLFGILLLRKWLQISVIHLGIVALLSEASSSCFKGFAFANWQLYLAIALGILKSMANPMCRTIITNIVPANELGKIFSFYSVLQCLVPLISSPFYTMIYSITLKSFPGLFNVVSANLYLLGISLFFIILRKKRISPSRYELLLN